MISDYIVKTDKGDHFIKWLRMNIIMRYTL